MVTFKIKFGEGFEYEIPFSRLEGTTMTEEEFLKELGAEVDTRRLSDNERGNLNGENQQVAGRDEGR